MNGNMRCPSCNKLLAIGSLVDGTLNIKCPRCKKVVNVKPFGIFLDNNSHGNDRYNKQLSKHFKRV